MIQKSKTTLAKILIHGALSLTLWAVVSPARSEDVLRGYSIPLLDLAAQSERQIVVDREPEQYLGHPTTVLLDDQRTIIAVYPKGHGRGPIVMKRSNDGGLTWSDRLPAPESWSTSKETPTIHRVVDSSGRSASSSGRACIRHDWPYRKTKGTLGRS